MYSALYQPETNTYLCQICGWNGYPKIPAEGWCPTEDVACVNCGPVEIEREKEAKQEPDLGAYFL